MSIQELGALGEFLGFLVVLVTLGYLAVQTRQTKQIAASETARGLVADFTRAFSAIRDDADLAQTIVRGINRWDALTRTEQLRAHAFLCDLAAHFTAASKAAYIRDLDVFLKAWEDNLLGVLQTPGGAHWWKQSQFFFDPHVVELLNARLAEPSALPPAWTAVPWWQVPEHSDTGS